MRMDGGREKGERVHNQQIRKVHISTGLEGA